MLGSKVSWRSYSKKDIGHSFRNDSDRIDIPESVTYERAKSVHDHVYSGAVY